MLESYGEKDQLKGSTNLAFFLFEAIKIILDLFNLAKKVKTKSGEQEDKNPLDSEVFTRLITDVDEFIIDAFFYQLCKISLKHKGFILLNLGTFEILKAYILFSENFNRTYKAELNTVFGMLFYNKLLSVEKRVSEGYQGYSLNKSEKVQVKILFDFLNFLISRPSILKTLYYYNDFTEVRSPLVSNILDLAFSVRLHRKDDLILIIFILDIPKSGSQPRRIQEI